ncbi:hypothetical protein QBC38DRAFT_481987 [Podospora fimiseda]|uniref:Uncharacterized protein n=1 Tax=Podospora fimiseda TaxID=252190 RepID=A0AAN7GZW6_9PEZI|nr:hypothetical protein QBC38DRAFT_481987 [Podospora fimiseda]
MPRSTQAIVKEAKQISPDTWSIPASKVTSAQLKRYLDDEHFGKYSVKLKRDVFSITISARSSWSV